MTDTSGPIDDAEVHPRKPDDVDRRPLRLIADAAVAVRSHAAIEQRQRVRFAQAVNHARTHSPFYRALYKHLPDDLVDPTPLPTTSKPELMAHFEEWVTDDEVSLEALRRFIADPERIGESYLGRYTVATTSGTTGEPGIFLIDKRILAVTSAMGVRMLRSWLGPREVLRILGKRGRTSMVMATGGHFASAAAAARISTSPRRSKLLQTLSVHQPVEDLVAQLNNFDPGMVAPYASVGAMLADEQSAGRLQIRPALVTLSAEGLQVDEYDRIAAALHCKVGNSYAATECTFLSYSCPENWLHVNADWVRLEPVNADGTPTPPGEQSHSLLLSNLANRIQPILRYDLGDSVLQHPGQCACGNRLPAIRVRGRASDVVTLTDDTGRLVSIPPLAFTLAVEQTHAVERHQIVQTSPDTFSVQLQPTPDRSPDQAWEDVRSALQRLFEEHGASHVTLRLDETPPQPARGGKLRSVTPLRRSSD